VRAGGNRAIVAPMKKYLLSALASALLSPLATYGQFVSLPDLSPKATVSQTIGITDATVSYHRPSVQKREVWGKLVPFGYNNLGFGTSKAAPWRAGANETTTISFSSDVTVAGSPLKAGEYGLFMAIAPDGTATWIFSHDTETWGSFFYDEAKDALRVTTKWEDAPFQEQLLYGFSDVTNDSAVLSLSWEKKRFALPIKVDTKQVVLAKLKDEMRGSKGFHYQDWVAASAYLLKNDLELPLALEWAEFAVSDPNIGERNFTTLSNKADILEKLGRAPEAAAVMDEAIKYGTAIEIHQYGRKLLAAHNKEKALEVFKLNAKLHPDVWPVNYGLARGYSAMGDYKAALEALLRAQTQIPDGDTLNVGPIKANIAKLKNGQDIN
jgi:tetratricopeptide (TPR) repeat protein